VSSFLFSAGNTSRNGFFASRWRRQRSFRAGNFFWRRFCICIVRRLWTVGKYLSQKKQDEVTMKKKTIAILVCAAFFGGLSLAHAADAERGKKLFEDPKLGGGTTGKSCATCHEGGSGIGDDIFTRDKYYIMGKEKSSLAGVINVCIEYPLGGHAIDPKGNDMQDIIAYMRELKGKK